MNILELFFQDLGIITLEQIFQYFHFQPVTAKLKVNNTKPKEIIAKHAALEKKRGRSAFPDMGSYKSYPVEYDTFGKMLALKEEKKNENQKRNYFGLEDRFRDPNKQKKKLQIPLGVDPGPGTY